jgi:hypothetical protein
LPEPFFHTGRLFLPNSGALVVRERRGDEEAVRNGRVKFTGTLGGTLMPRTSENIEKVFDQLSGIQARLVDLGYGTAISTMLPKHAVMKPPPLDELTSGSTSSNTNLIKQPDPFPSLRELMEFHTSATDPSTWKHAGPRSAMPIVTQSSGANAV